MTVVVLYQIASLVKIIPLSFHSFKTIKVNHILEEDQVLLLLSEVLCQIFQQLDHLLVVSIRLSQLAYWPVTS